MRPIYLEMNSFGSYKNCKLNFEELGKDGLYLITGKTGSGKTTIFDAITYALYGASSGGARNSSMMVSHFLDKGSKPEVKLVFAVDDKKYTVTRSPAYEIPNRKTPVPAAACLEFSDGRKPVEKDVTEEVEKILGMTRTQFKQIMMLAQGDFLELLIAGAKEKKTILRDIFGTEKDKKFQELIDGKFNDLDKEFKLKKNSVLDIVKSVQCEDDSEIGAKKKTIIDNELANLDTLNEFSELLGALISDAENKLNKLKAEEKELDEHDKVLTEQITKGRERDEFIKKIRELEDTLPELEKSAKRLEESAEQLRRDNEPKVKKLREKVIPQIELSLGDYEKRDVLRQEEAQLKERISENQSDLDKIVLKLKELSDKRDDDQKELEALGNTGENIAKLESEIKDIEQKIKALLELKKSADELKKIRGEYEDSLIDYDKANKDCKDLQTRSNDLFELFWNEQAGILAAEKLTDGEPCPVCGSVHHPKIARKSENAPTKAEVDAAKAKAEAANNTLSQTGAKCAELKNGKENAEKEIKKMIDALLLDCGIDEAAGTAEREREKVNEKLDELKRKLSEETKKSERRTELNDEIPQLDEQIKQTVQRKNDMENDNTAKSTKLEEIKKQLEDLSGLKFETKDAAEREINALSAEAKQLGDDIISAQENAMDEAEKLKEANTQISTYRETVSQMPECDVAALETEQKALTEKKKTIEETMTARRVENACNSKAFKNISDEYKKLVELERDRDDYHILARTANSKKGAMIDFESYVQSVYFEKVLFHANAHFRMMSGGQFELIRKTDGSGLKNFLLDMDVMDSYTGRERDVNSISGGEKFMASLSLALGLSETVQENSGAIHLETMFIDEGFGSLDGEKLEEAVGLLNGLADGRIIGIISHVEALKNEVAKKIIVTKDEKSGSHAEIRV